MRLGQKNLAYSMVLAGIMLLFLVGYFIYMLPYLYVEHMMELNLRSVREQHDSYVEKHTYEGVQVKNSVACFSVEVPMEGNRILVTGKAFSAEILLKDEGLLDILEQCRKMLRRQWDGSKKEEETGRKEDSEKEKESGREVESDFKEEWEKIAEILEGAVRTEGHLPVEVRMLYTLDMTDMFSNEAFKIHSYSETKMVVETSVEDGDNQYVNYMAIEWVGDSMIVSFLPIVAPRLDEIRPVVMQSLPMLGAVIMLMVLLFSGMYSKGIVAPIVELVHRTEQMKNVKDSPVERLSGKWRGRRDEVGQLADTLDDFYLQIREGYQKLEEKNRRQEVFLRASSHQLKTPIAAALLLVDGMMNEIGRYKDTKVYLPKVKEQLLFMRTMVEDILYLTRCEENMSFCQVEAVGLLKARLHLLQISIGKKRLSVGFGGRESLVTDTDERMFAQILDNLLSNAVKYTPEGGRIEISIEQGEWEGIRIDNFGVTIPKQLLPHIYEPFVSGSHGGSCQGGLDGAPSHGLGLYIASYYAQKLGLSLQVQNGREECVTAMLVFGKKDMK